MAKKILTPEIARMSSRIRIGTNVITVEMEKRSRTYGVVKRSYAFQKTESNLKVANRYK